MSTIQDANQIIRTAEAALRSLMEQAIREQRYADVGAVAPLAEGLTKLVRGEPVLASVPVVIQERRADRKSPKSKTEYPRFVRDGDKLVKIGWSKKSKSVYEHRAPLVVVETFLASVRAKVRDGQQFAATDVIPVTSTEEAVPDYQAYLALKWLHAEGVVTKHGRDRYAVELGRVGPEGLKPIWNRLPTTRGGGVK